MTTLILLGLLLIFMPVVLVAAANRRDQLRNWGVPRAVGIATYQGWVSPHHLMRQAHLKLSHAQFILDEARKQSVLYQAVNGRYYLAQIPPAFSRSTERSNRLSPDPPAVEASAMAAGVKIVNELYSSDKTRKAFIMLRDEVGFIFEEYTIYPGSRTWAKAFRSNIYTAAEGAESAAISRLGRKL